MRAITPRRDIIVLSDAGLHDTRATKAPLPWAAILTVTAWRSGPARYVSVAADPNLIERLKRSAKISSDYISILCNGLNISQKELAEAIEARRTAAPSARS